MAMIKASVHKLMQAFQPFDWHHAVVCAPGMMACLVYGLFSHDTITAAIAAGSAFSVGFGLRRYRQTRSMLAAILLTTGAAVVGSLTGTYFPLYLLLASAASAASMVVCDDAGSGGRPNMAARSSGDVVVMARTGTNHATRGE